jgi:hypothetical protein
MGDTYQLVNELIEIHRLKPSGEELAPLTDEEIKILLEDINKLKGVL